MKQFKTLKKCYGHPDPALPSADKWAQEAREARAESRPAAGLDLPQGRGQSAPTTWPARDVASRRPARGRGQERKRGEGGVLMRGLVRWGCSPAAPTDRAGWRGAARRGAVAADGGRCRGAPARKGEGQ
jgi:hypothetical protein